MLRSEPARVGAAADVFTAGPRLLLFTAFALLVAMRLPQAWVHGRFIDEEATVFLAYAWHRPWLDALFRPFAGYWNLAANATTLVVARLVQGGAVRLEHAPYVTMGVALALQVLPGVLVLTGRAAWLGSRPAVIAALLVIAIAPATEEVFFNVLHIQFHLALCVALILALEVPERRLTWAGYGVLLFLAPLCGPGAIVVLPLFALRALLERDRGRLGQLLVFGSGAAVQLLLFYGASPVRSHVVEPATLLAVFFVRLIALPALNFANANRIGEAINASQEAGGVGWWLAAVAATIAFGALIVVAARRRDGAVWLLLAGLGIAAASFGFGMVNPWRPLLFHAGAGERYNFLPLVLIGLTLVALAARRRGLSIYALLAGLFLLTGAFRYPAPSPEFNGGPSWPAEVAAWRSDHDHQLAVWPRPWRADLSDRSRPCTPPGPDPARSTDPRYCESGWAAPFFRIQDQRR